MKKIDIPATITEAQARSGYTFVLIARESTESSSRTVPYADLYRSRTSIMETPAEYLQKAGEDEKARKARLSKAPKR